MIAQRHGPQGSV